jgi:hypothetical protein
MADGDVFDAHRLIRTGPDAWRSSYLGSATTLEASAWPPSSSSLRQSQSAAPSMRRFPDADRDSVGPVQD